MVTTTLLWFCSRRATSIAAQAAAPQLIPHIKPSSLARRREVSMASPPTPEARDDHSIGDVAEATGVTPETLRVWERRYGRPKALRLPSGHRRYTDAHIRWLRRVTEALARGHRPHKVVPLDDAALDALLAPKTAGPDVSREAEELLDLVRAFDATTLR